MQPARRRHRGRHASGLRPCTCPDAGPSPCGQLRDSLPFILLLMLPVSKNNYQCLRDTKVAVGQRVTGARPGVQPCFGNVMHSYEHICKTLCIVHLLGVVPKGHAAPGTAVGRGAMAPRWGWRTYAS